MAKSANSGKKVPPRIQKIDVEKTKKAKKPKVTCSPMIGGKKY